MCPKVCVSPPGFADSKCGAFFESWKSRKYLPKSTFFSDRLFYGFFIVFSSLFHWCLVDVSMVFTSLFRHGFFMFFGRLCFRISDLFDFLLFRRHAFYPMKTMVLTHSTLSENLNSILKHIKNNQKTNYFWDNFRIDFSSIFMPFSASIFASIFSSIFNEKCLQKWSQK